MNKYNNLTLAVTSKGRAMLYTDPTMPILNNPEIEQTFPLGSKLAVKALIRDYRGKARAEVQKTLSEALKLF